MKPLICAHMGDPAGVGPEILAASLVDPVVTDVARVLVVGNTEIMRRASAIMNVSPEAATLWKIFTYCLPTLGIAGLALSRAWTRKRRRALHVQALKAA